MSDDKRGKIVLRVAEEANRPTPRATFGLAPAKEVTLQPTQEQKAADFRALHEGEAFIIPNPWDAGSARVLEALGFKAVGCTNSIPPAKSPDLVRGRVVRPTASSVRHLARGTRPSSASMAVSSGLSLAIASAA
jgi:hypothetical protein